MRHVTRAYYLSLNHARTFTRAHALFPSLSSCPLARSFETSMLREKFPERVPFRLTRMLVSAMEVSGIEGNYRSTAEAAMRVLRTHRDSVMALLEAFVHDPLINWRLIGGAGGAAATAAGAAAADAAAGGTLVQRRRPAASSAAAGGVQALGGVEKLAAGDASSLALLTKQGLEFARESEDANIRATMATTGFNANPAEGGGVLDADVNHALARSIAVSASMRGGREPMQFSMRGGPGGDLDSEGLEAPPEILNEKAMTVIRRIAAKLTGRDFAEGDQIGELMSVGLGLGEPERLPSALFKSVGEGGSTTPFASGRPSSQAATRYGVSGPLDVDQQVHRLICAAMAHENLSQCFIGWCPWW